jgi:hypothetical protein
VRRLLLALAASAGVAALIAAVSQSSAGTGSGVRGRVLYGPTCPVERVGQICTRPYQASITIRREPSRSVAARLRSSIAGYFSVPLPPGRYLLIPQSGRPFPIGMSQSFIVRRGRYTTLTVHYDSGIR